MLQCLALTCFDRIPAFFLRMSAMPPLFTRKIDRIPAEVHRLQRTEIKL